MTIAILSLLFGAAAGFVLPVGGFAIGLLAFLVMTGFVLVGAAASAWWIVGGLLAAAVFAQVGYFTAVYFQATVIGAKRAHANPVEQIPVSHRREPTRLAEHSPGDD